MPTLRYLYKKIVLLFLTGVMVVGLCEIYFRLPFLPGQLEYQPDSEFGAELRAKQKGFIWLGNMSFKSPPIMINSDGHRGRETDWDKPVILAAGDSEAFGAGVRDDETWTACLEENLRNQLETGDLQVVNIAHPGHGPYHHYVRIVRALAKGDDIKAVIVRVDIADRNFNRLPEMVLSRQIRAASIRRQIRGHTKALPYLFNKTMAQVRTIKRVLTAYFSKKRRPSGLDAAVGMSMWEENRRWWEAMAVQSLERDIPLIFLIHDMSDTDAAKVLEVSLDRLSEKNHGIYVLRMGPRDFGLGGGGRNRNSGSGMDRLVLERDPHASSLQHELIARRVFGFLIKEKVGLKGVHEQMGLKNDKSDAV